MKISTPYIAPFCTYISFLGYLLITFIPTIFLPSSTFAKTVFYSIHIGSYKYIESAHEEVTQMERFGYNSFYRLETIEKKGEWYRVYIGKYETKNEAEREAETIKNSKVISYYKVLVVEEEVEQIEMFEIFEGREIDDLLAEEEILMKAEIEREILESQRRIIEAENSKRQIGLPDKVIEPESVYLKENSEEFSDNIVSETDVNKSHEYSLAVSTAQINENTVLDQKETKGSTDFETNPSGIKIKGSFSFSFRSGVFIAQGVEDFEVSKTGTSNIDRWNYSGGTAFQVALTPSYNINDFFSIESSIEKILADGMDMSTFTLGPKMTLKFLDWFFPYQRFSVVYGKFDWGDVPGGFDDGIGWDTAIGVCFSKSKFKIGTDFSYRDVKFDYNVPSGQNINVTDEVIDLSGFIVSGTIVYYF